MAGPTLRDRLLGHRASRAAGSPSAIVLAGAGVAVGILAGLPLVGVAALGAGAWALRVAASLPRRGGDRVDAMALGDPWRGFVWEAQEHERRFDEATGRARTGPLQERLAAIGERIEDAVAECWRVARAGQALTEARSAVDVVEAHRDLQSLVGADGRLPPPESNLGRTAAALEAQLATAERLDATIADARDRLQLLDARLGEAVTRAIELSVRTDAGDELGPLRGLGDDVEGLVVELESLRSALDETSPATGAPDPSPTTDGDLPGTVGPRPGPRPTPSAAPPPPTAPPRTGPPTWERGGGPPTWSDPGPGARPGPEEEGEGPGTPAPGTA